MDPEYNLQDVLRCHLCETPGPDLHCDICKTYLCNACEKTHLADESKEHKVVSFKLRRQSTFCKNIFQNYVSITVKNATFLFVIHVLLLESIDVTKFLTRLHILNRKKLSYEKIYKNYSILFSPDTKKLHITSKRRGLI